MQRHEKWAGAAAESVLMKVRKGDFGCEPDVQYHAWAWDELIRQNVCSRCGILESWIAQERSDDIARRLLDG